MADKIEFKVGDDVKFQEENSMMVQYGVIVGVYKVNVKIEDENGDTTLINKKNVWWD